MTTADSNESLNGTNPTIMTRIITRIFHCALAAGCFLGIVLTGATVCAAKSETRAPLLSLQAPPVELAEYMTQLQVYTHKLSLSVAASNVPLAQFYLHESVAHLKRIQELFPEYEGQPIALLIDRLAIESYELLNTLFAEEGAEASKDELDHALEVIINACNACHISSNAPIRIQRNDTNPYMQDFNP